MERVRVSNEEGERELVEGTREREKQKEWRGVERWCHRESDKERESLGEIRK